MSPVKPLSPEALCARCDPARLLFHTTEELEDLDEPLGQERAAEGLRFGVGIRREGYHLFAMGPVDTGKRTFVSDYLEQRAAREPVPPDVAYVHDFETPHRPRALTFPAGRGEAFRKDMETLVEDLRAALPTALESDEQRARRQAIEQEMKERQEGAFSDLKVRAEERGIAFLHTPLGFGFAPQKDGEVVTPDQFQQMPEEDRQRIENDVNELQEQLRQLLEKVQGWEKDARERTKALLREVSTGIVQRQMKDFREKYGDLPDVLAHLEALERDVLEHVVDFLRPQQGPIGAMPVAANGDSAPLGFSPLRRYLVNLLVRQDGAKGAPVVYEENPTYENLVGRVEHIAQMGTLLTDFHLIKGGALHRANGGYLVVEAHRLLGQPYAYDALKRALQTCEIRIESLGQRLGLVSTISLEPEPIPLRVKVVLLGERRSYHLLDALDPEFPPLFKVPVDFEDEIARGEENERRYARLVATAARRQRVRPLQNDAVARVLDHRSRLAGDAEKFSAHMGSLVDLLHEADWWAGDAGRSVIAAEDVDRAIDAAENRLGRVHERLLEDVKRGTILLATQGTRVGQVNALSMLQLGRIAFGRPIRVTAKVRLGGGRVIDIEREVELGGPIHSKGVLILSGFLGARYAPRYPLAVGITLVFEQSYGQVEGDSASCAELCALLSAISEIPLRQNLAMTGSVDQHGDVQPVGGVNEKIESFLETCRIRGFTGDQGVILPATNVKHLMLRREVVDAVRAGRFNVWPVSTVDEAMELLTGLPPGERGADGKFPKGTINGRVEAKLISLAKRSATWSRVASRDPRQPESFARPAPMPNVERSDPDSRGPDGPRPEGDPPVGRRPLPGSERRGEPRDDPERPS